MCVIVPRMVVLFVAQLFCIGDKSRAQIARDYKEAMTLSVDSCFDKDAARVIMSQRVCDVAAQSKYEILV